MNKEEARQELKIGLAEFAVKYPRLVNRTGAYISRASDSDIALSEIVVKLIELDQYVEWLFREELDIDITNNRNTDER